jgi:hypothetical protein
MCLFLAGAVTLLGAVIILFGEGASEREFVFLSCCLYDTHGSYQ